MGLRPLRHYYGRDSFAVPSLRIDPSFSEIMVPWHRHRDRLTGTLRGLTAEQWLRPTRCTNWNVREVVGHLVVVDGFWVMTLTNAFRELPLTTMLEGFDPSSSTDAMVAATTTLDIAALLDRFATGTEELAAVLDALTDDAWETPCESPLGHLPAAANLGHAFWDSWLHERDMLEPLDRAPDIFDDELLAATRFSLVFAGLQGGVLGDPSPVGPGPARAIDVAIVFDDLVEHPLRVHIGQSVRIGRATPGDAVPAGSAIDLVEGLTGRRLLPATLAALPTDLAAQVARAALVF